MIKKTKKSNCIFKISILVFFSFFSISLLADSITNNKAINITRLEKELEEVDTGEKPKLLIKLARDYLSIDPEKSKTYSEEAIELSRILENPGEQLTALYYLGEAYYFLDQNEAAIKTYNRLIELLEKTNNDTLLSETYRSLGITYNVSNHGEEAIQYIQKSLEIEERLNRKSKIAISNFNLGNIYHELNEFQLSIQCLNKSLNIYDSLGLLNWTSTVHNSIGTVYLNLGSFEKALGHYKASLTIQEDTDDKKGMAQTLNNIGIVYSEWNHKEKALAYYQNSLKIEEELENMIGQADSYNNIGIIYSDWDQDKIAQEYYNKALGIYKEYNHNIGIAVTENNLGESFFNEGKHELALEYLFRSLKYEEEIENLPGIASSFHSIGKVYFKLGNIDEALTYNRKSLQIAKSHQLLNIMLANYKFYYEIYSSQNNISKALDYYIKYANQKDTVFSSGFHRSVAELQAKYEIDKIDKERDLLAKSFLKKDSEVKTQRIYLIIIFLLMIVFGVLVYYDIRSKITANNKLRLINEELTEQKTQLTIVLDNLGKSESKYKTLIENSPTGILYVNSDGSIQEVNNKMLEILGSPDEKLTKKINCLTFPALKRIGLSDQLTECLEQGKNIYAEKIYFSKWKKKTYLRYFITPVIDQKEKVRNAIINVEDITQSKEAEESRKITEEKYRILVENSLQAMVIVQEKGLIFANSRMEELTQFTFDELVEKGTDWIKDFIHPDDFERINRILGESFNKQRIPARNEMRIFRKDGKIRWVETLGTLVNFQGKDAILLVAMDITDKKEAQVVLVESEKTLRSVNAMKDKFFSIIAHDLKNPFNAIIGFSNLLYEAYDNFDEEQRKSFIKNICDASESTFKLLQNLLEWSRTQTGSFDYSPEVLDLSIITNENVSILKSSADNKKIEIKSNVPYNSIVYADENMTKAIIRNLISNAIKFTEEEGKVSISVLKNKNTMEVTVADNGIGISKENTSRLFRIDDPYKAPGTANEQGTGLGLILCKEFVEKNGGKIWVESKVGVGSKFIFTLPLQKNN